MSTIFRDTLVAMKTNFLVASRVCLKAIFTSLTLPRFRLTLLRLAVACFVFAASLHGSAEQPQLHGHWLGTFQKLDNGEDNTLYIDLDQNGDKLTGHFRTIGYAGDLSGTLHEDHFILFAGWDKVKPFCTGSLKGADLSVNLGWGSPFDVHPQTAAEKPIPPAYIAPPALHKVPSNGLAKTPPMGWNSWNHFGGGVNDADVRAAADALVSSGMRDAGYVYVNIDDTWEGVRDANGVLQANHKFPDMKALASYVHARGLKLGIYSSPGPRTCGGYPGSYGHEDIDAKTWAAWGIDYLKYDWCSAAELYKDADLQAVYQKMGDALASSGRPIVYSLCEYGTNHVENWGADVGANLWRTTGDIRDEWSSMEANGFSQDRLAAAAGPGHWNDPDMLEVGNGHMTPDEYRTHMSLWSLLASPLLAGNDLSKLQPDTLALLTNKSMIAIDQDPLGSQARRLSKVGDVDTWSRPLADGGHAIGIFNRGAKEAVSKLSSQELKIAEDASVVDVWTHKQVHFVHGEYEATLPPHGTLMLRVAVR